MDDFGPSSFGKFRQKSQEGGVKRLLIEEKLPEQKLPVQQQQQQQQSGRLQRKKVSTAARSSASPFERSKFDPFSEMAKEWVFFFWTLWPTLKFGSFLTKWRHTVKLLVANNEFVLWYTYLPNCQLRQKVLQYWSRTAAIGWILEPTLNLMMKLLTTDIKPLYADWPCHIKWKILTYTF